MAGKRQRAPWWEPIAASIGFLTVLPVPHVALSPTLAGRAAALFPPIGALIGIALGGLGLWLDRILPAGPAAVLLIAAGVLLTGGLHLDGLMDTADGAFGGRSAEQRLTIMRDSRIGAFGALAGGLTILGQFACLSELTGHARFVALVVAATIGRWTMLVALAMFPPARTAGIGVAFQNAATYRTCLPGTLGVVVLAIVAGQLGLIALVTGSIVVLAGGHALTRLLGGLTGDTYGAIAVAAETAILFVAVAIR